MSAAPGPGNERRSRVTGGNDSAVRSGEVLVTVDETAPNPVVHATIDRPAARNALSVPVLDGLVVAVDTAIEREASVLVVRGTAGTLSAGADLQHVRSLAGDAGGMDAYIATIGAALDRIEAAPCVTVAVVGEGGYALAGGCELLLACDLAVAAADARLGDRHLEYGLLPGAGGSVRLPRTVPAALARRLLFTGEIVDGATAHAWGLVSHTGDDAVVAQLLARLARHSGPALRAMKELHRASAPPADPTALAAERAVTVAHIADSATVREGLDAFVGGRRPDFSAAHLGGSR